MVTNFEELVALCDEELQHREYESNYYVRITAQWNALREWLKSKEISEFSEAIGKQYCDEIFGTHLMPKRAPAHFSDYSGSPAHPGRSSAQPDRASAHLIRSAVQLMPAADQHTC